jgi:oligopeptide/dipeptide ABC transporter ATP-binding protein
MRLGPLTAGEIYFRGEDIAHWGHSELRPSRRNMQILFQDPYSSLDPRMKVSEIIAEPLRIHHRYGHQGLDQIKELMEQVGLNPDQHDRYPHQFSGGQRQRIGIARAIALKPGLLILDEPASAMDVSVQAQVINLLMDLQRDLGMSYVFIAHDLGVVRQISHRVAVMYLGRVVESGTTEEVYNSPRHPYTKALLSAVPIATPFERETKRRITLTGDVPNPADPPSGCHFRTRCFRAQEVCAVDDPALTSPEGHTRAFACHFPLEVSLPAERRPPDRGETPQPNPPVRS